MRNRFFTLFCTVILTFLTITGSTTAQNTQGRPSDRQVLEVLNRIDRNLAEMRSQLANQDFTNDRRDQASAVTSLETALGRLRADVNYRRDSSADLDAALSQARTVDSLVSRSYSAAALRTNWMAIRNDLDALAGYYNRTTAWNGYSPGDTRNDTRFGYYSSDTEMRTLVSQLQSDQSLFRSSYNRWSRSNWRSILTGNTTEVNRNITALDQAISRLNTNYRTNTYRSDDVSQLLRTASAIDQFVSANRVNTEVTTRWNQVRSDLETLAGYYRVSWNWNGPNYPTPGDNFSGFDARLTGTFRLNESLSDDVRAAVERTISANTAQSDWQRRNLERRLRSPEMLAIEKRGSTVTLASSNAPAVELTADGRARTETSPNGRSVTTSVTTTGREVTINYQGDRMNDFFVSFTPSGRDQLRVTRRVYLEGQNQQITVTSVYDRTSPTAQLDTIYTPRNDSTFGTNNTWAIPNNTALTATLDTPLSSRNVREGDRFTMTVTSPSPYDGAVIEGTVASRERSGLFTGNANLNLNFNTIRMRDGRTYQFAGIVNQVRQPNGDIVTVNNEGEIRDNSQTKQTVTRAGIGAALGAIIGAIAGGGSGAAIGAGVGAGAGVGSVVLQGRNNLDLATGSQFSITATAPVNIARVRP